MLPSMRAVAVLEWTGEEGHPKASRLVPVSVYDGQELQDGGIYLAQPAPLALSSEVEYELKQNGKTIGLFDINNAGPGAGFVGWIRRMEAVAEAQAGQHERPRSASDDPGAATSRATGRSCIANMAPTTPLHRERAAAPGRRARPRTQTALRCTRRTSGDSGDANTASSSAPAPDPDRPTLHKKASDSDSCRRRECSGRRSGPAHADRRRARKDAGRCRLRGVGAERHRPQPATAVARQASR